MQFFPLNYQLIKTFKKLNKVKSVSKMLSFLGHVVVSVLCRGLNSNNYPTPAYTRQHTRAANLLLMWGDVGSD